MSSFGCRVWNVRFRVASGSSKYACVKRVGAAGLLLFLKQSSGIEQPPSTKQIVGIKLHKPCPVFGVNGAVGSS